MIYVAKNPVTADSVRVRIKRALGEKKCCYGSDSSEYRKHVFVSNMHESKRCYQEEQVQVR